MEYLILWLACGVGAAAIASSKNRSVFGWLLGGFLLGPIGLLIVGFMGKAEVELAPGTERKCPHCAEMIKTEAKVCKHCGRDVEPEKQPQPNVPGEPAVCPLCKKQVPEGNSICPSCFAHLPE